METAVHVLMGLSLAVMAGVLVFLVCWAVVWWKDRKEAKRQAQQAAAQKASGGGGGPDPVR